MTFNSKLRSLIDEKNITQKKLALDLNIAPSTIGGYVQGTSEPDFDTLKKVAEYFNVSSDYLLDIPYKKTNTSLEGELLRVFRTLTSEQQLIYLEQGKAFLKMNEKKSIC